jgi:hypothetical protein
LLVSLVTVLGKPIPVIEATCRVCHHLEEGSVEAEVVAVTQEVIVPSEGSVSFKLVVAIKTWLASSESRSPRGSVGSITTNGKFLGLEITISQCQTEESEKIRQVVANVVEVLLSIDKLIKGGDTITSKEVVVGSSVQSWARTTNVIGSWSDELMSGVTRGRDKVSSLSVTLFTILGTVVWVLIGDTRCWYVVLGRVVWASQRSTWVCTT